MELELDLQRQVQLPSLNNWGDDAWRSKAACKGKDTRVFFPEKEDLSGMTVAQKKARERTKDSTNPNLQGNMLSRARLLCAKCSVRKECLAFALDNGLTYGMYGGQTSRDRRKMSLDNLEQDSRIPVRYLITDIQRMRRMEGKPKPVSLAADLAPYLDTTTSAVERMIKNNALPEFI
jgi:WhiB family redox-sensing transcriptional regulator